MINCVINRWFSLAKA